ncbi:MAG: dihydroorotate dehydrogenase [Limisphaerales bacterium]|jgi:dihydroorotate dehydrogenase
MYRLVLKPLFFLLNAEKAHYTAMALLYQLASIPGGNSLIKLLFTPDKKWNKPVVLWNLKFPHAVGLAAGFDKDARWVDELEHLGFAFVEIGTVTPLPQIGNDKPRLFRLPKDRGLINRMGFNNRGAAAAASRLAMRKGKVIIGGNIGKNKITPNVEAINDYVHAFRALYNEVDYFVVNVSSPNTPGLRELQDRGPLTAILNRLHKENELQAEQTQIPTKPILLKIAPDLTNSQLDDIVELVLETNTNGIICTNTTISRAELNTEESEVKDIGAGGLSGDPLRARSTEVIRYVRAKAGPDLPIIGVGGVRTAAHVNEKLQAGANLVQVYSGFIYEGPNMVKNILKGL